MDRQLISWRVGGVGLDFFFFFFTVGHYLNDIHSLLSLDFAQQAATRCYFKISKSHWKILVGVLVWEEELVEKGFLSKN